MACCTILFALRVPSHVSGYPLPVPSTNISVPECKDVFYTSIPTKKVAYIKGQSGIPGMFLCSAAPKGLKAVSNLQPFFLDTTVLGIRIFFCSRTTFHSFRTAVLCVVVFVATFLGGNYLELVWFFVVMKGLREIVQKELVLLLPETYARYILEIIFLILI